MELSKDAIGLIGCAALIFLVFAGVRVYAPLPDAVVEAAASELAAVLAGVVDPSELFHCGRVQVRGDLGLAMRLLSSIGV